MVYIIAALVLTTQLPHQETVELMPGQFVDHFDQATSAIVSYDVTLTVDSRRRGSGAGLEAPASPVTYRLVFQRDGVMRRIEAWAKDQGSRRSPASITVIDRESRRSYYSSGKQGLVDVRGSEPVIDGLDYNGFFRNATEDYELPEILRRRLKQASAVERIPQSHRLRMSIPPIKAASYDIFTDRFGYEITVDPARGFFPSAIRVNGLRKNGSIALRRETEITEFVSTPKGIQVPSKVTTRIYNIDEPVGLMSSVTVEVDTGASRWNDVIPPETFQLGFPVGTRVVDMHQKTRFISGKEDPGASVKELIAQASDSVPLGSARQLKIPPPPWWLDWHWLAPLSAGVLFLAVMTYRSLRRKGGR